MDRVAPKKHLGQHFLADLNISRRIAESLRLPEGVRHVLEVGPGMGVLTQFLLERTADYETTVVEIDRESVAYLKVHFPGLQGRILEADFLKMDLGKQFDGAPLSVIGNFPYNISSQIYFRILAHRQQVRESVGMIQKEVAERIAAGPGSKTYGILSVLVQAWYDVELLFLVPPHVFIPPPKVQSAVLRLTRNKVEKLDCDEVLFFRVVKQAFATRRKTLRNCMKMFGLSAEVTADPLFDKRAEQLSVADFVGLTQLVSAQMQSANQ
ncbi:16S rRNA (adenine(1518)-N(6)/adenine(1519)-N(6))-dimethyltransferase RsmA [Hymenobacter busanensis]|uniref:16S rRNA (adenine(1518)-N(6)/adenine(1519)-N(6))- dimethyltransferase RsmA n=1 Tax=Hymenobacter busanensis TaxID=2607656 RepID=UPI00191C1DBB|nr:16S rRNA (adenine(1518)-N(6)/adenine(1519)-N(6))-dimethyltransferase RsmA [Hymenobacter busanensis]